MAFFCVSARHPPFAGVVSTTAAPVQTSCAIPCSIKRTPYKLYTIYYISVRRYCKHTRSLFHNSDKLNLNGIFFAARARDPRHDSNKIYVVQAPCSVLFAVKLHRLTGRYTYILLFTLLQDGTASCARLQPEQIVNFLFVYIRVRTSQIVQMRGVCI